MTRCRQCPAPVEPGEDLCGPCSIELAHRIMNAEPEPHFLYCEVCQAPYSYVEARVLREAKNPCNRLSPDTPHMCWVCAHLHLAAMRDCLNCDRPH